MYPSKSTAIMKKNIISIVFACILALVLTSCEEKLRIEQHGVLNYNSYYSNDEEIESAASAMYYTIADNVWKYSHYFFKDMLTDDYYCGGGVRGDETIIEAINEFTFDAESDFIEDIFSYFYNVIYYSNVILGHIDEDFSEVAARTVAEARVFRAWMYFELVTMWGNPPLVDHELSGSEYDQPNSTSEELWALIESDLTTAIESGNLPEKTGLNDKETWRVTKQYAQAILGKAYLWQEKYSEAAAIFDEIINSGLYALFTEGDYGDLHLSAYKHNCENLFESNKVYDANNPWGNFQMYYIQINWRMDQLNYPSDTPIMNTGWGYAIPTQSLYDAFVSVEGADGYRLNQTMITYQQMQDNLDMSVASTMISTGYFMWKTRALKSERGYDSDYVYAADLLWMRYAEVLLLAAEANLRNGNSSKATTYFNQVRSRAKAPTVSSVTLDQIKVEKRLELCMEGTRFQDLLRYDALGETSTGASTMLANNGATYPQLHTNGSVEYVSCGNSTYGFKTGKHEYLPYPATEIRLNSNITQNPGY